MLALRKAGFVSRELQRQHEPPRESRPQANAWKLFRSRSQPVRKCTYLSVKQNEIPWVWVGDRTRCVYNLIPFHVTTTLMAASGR